MSEFWEIHDKWAPESLLRKAAHSWPGRDWPHWFRYDTPLERKSTCNDWKQMPEACRQVLVRMLTVHSRPGLIPDVSLYGAGMHSMYSGDHLDRHLDSDRHPVFGLERRLNAILFLSEEWEKEWGGYLEFWTPDLKERLAAVRPHFNRLVFFETSDTSVHGIPAPIACPPEACRKTLAVYWYAWPHAPGKGKRPRARYLGTDDDPTLEELRRERAGLG